LPGPCGARGWIACFPFEIAVKYDRTIYDALFVALAKEKGLQGVTADEPLFNVTHADFPQIILLRNL
jgi:predicted nucleic acid-binding protein